MRWDHGDGSATITYSPQQADVGLQYIEVRASDGIFEDTLTIVIGISEYFDALPLAIGNYWVYDHWDREVACNSGTCNTTEIVSTDTLEVVSASWSNDIVWWALRGPLPGIVGGGDSWFTVEFDTLFQMSVQTGTRARAILTHRELSVYSVLWMGIGYGYMATVPGVTSTVPAGRFEDVVEIQIFVPGGLWDYERVQISPGVGFIFENRDYEEYFGMESDQSYSWDRHWKLLEYYVQ
jgi:hypothetical protein